MDPGKRGEWSSFLEENKEAKAKERGKQLEERQ